MKYTLPAGYTYGLLIKLADGPFTLDYHHRALILGMELHKKGLWDATTEIAFHNVHRLFTEVYGIDKRPVNTLEFGVDYEFWPLTPLAPDFIEVETEVPDEATLIFRNQQREALDRYHSHYRNPAYTFLRDELGKVLCLPATPWRTSGPDREAILDLLGNITNVALEISGHPAFSNAHNTLINLLCKAPFDSTITTEIIRYLHLYPFNQSGLNLVAEIAATIVVHQETAEALHHVQNATNKAAELETDFGRARHHLLFAAEQLMIAAQSLRPSTYADSYFEEKMRRVASQIDYARRELKQHA